MVNGDARTVTTAVGSIPSSIGTNANPLYLGSRQNYVAGQYFDGDIALPKIYNRALSTEEIADIYQAELQWFAP